MVPSRSHAGTPDGLAQGRTTYFDQPVNFGRFGAVSASIDIAVEYEAVRGKMRSFQVPSSSRVRHKSSVSSARLAAASFFGSSSIANAA